MGTVWGVKARKRLTRINTNRGVLQRGGKGKNRGGVTNQPATKSRKREVRIMAYNVELNRQYVTEPEQQNEPGNWPECVRPVNKPGIVVTNSG